MMANAMCRDGYCDYERNESEFVCSDIESGNRVIMAGLFILAVVLFAAMWYEATQGLYIDIVP